MTAGAVLSTILSEIGLERSDPQLSGNDYEITQLLSFMNATGSDLCSRTEWSRLFKEFSVPEGSKAADLPDDFHKIPSMGTVRLNDGAFTPLRPIVAPEMWNMLTARPSKQGYYNLRDGRIHFSPVLPDGGATVRYLSNHWVEGKPVITENGDNLLVPQRLIVKGTIYRWKRQKGLPFEDYMAEFEADLVADIRADRGEG